MTSPKINISELVGWGKAPNISHLRVNMVRKKHKNSSKSVSASVEISFHFKLVFNTMGLRHMKLSKLHKRFLSFYLTK